MGDDARDQPPPWSAADTVRLLEPNGSRSPAARPRSGPRSSSTRLSPRRPQALRLCVVATAPAPPELVERVPRALGCPLVVRYAMTESPSITGTEPGDDPEVLFRTVGRPQAGVEMELRDDRGARRRRRGGTRARAFGLRDARLLARETGTAEALDGRGWLRCSDLGRLDPAGNLVLVGRAGDMYIRGGYNVYPLEVENVLAEHPAVDQVSVIGVPAPVIGEIGVAFVVPAAGAAPRARRAPGLVP